ncbi:MULTISPECIES: hypothetical protein [Azospirillaceae]|uniref:hypothetical protein n=1 Tax=Azospirillaceae TaxID=2829815 RepID=UPI000B75D30C|nr:MULTISPECIES: hypothetical protein [Azospirillaceae]MDG5495079.1 hypothetical protein [Niveispirillum sp. BGYR6]SNR94257.1 hypothetical protein SAMN05880556_101682 [Azospirillum sp. RU38E]SNS10279.1 hypothetical protein SAMN05880591_101682 [Azospirillum sp. RU37A]
MTWMAGLGFVLSAAALAGFRLAWARQDQARWAALALGIALVLATLWAWSMAAGAEVGIPLGITCLCLAGYLFVGANMEIRPARARRVTATPEERKPKFGRGVVRFILAGPLGAVASIGIGIAVAMQAPMVEQTRLVIGATLVPLVWAGCMAWTLCDGRVIRSAMVLSGTAIAGYAVALLPLLFKGTV